MKGRPRTTVLLVAAQLAMTATGSLAAQAPGTYQRTVTKSCAGLCAITFPATGAQVLKVENVNCGLTVAAAKTPLQVALTSDKDDGPVFLVPKLTYASSDYRVFVISDATSFQVRPGAKITLTTNIPGTFATPQTCTIAGRYL